MSKIDLTNLNKIDTDLIMPSTSEENVNLQKQQENKWGSILNNQTFNTLNNNIKLLKNSLVETINTLNNENIVAKNKYINEDTDTLNIGDSNKKLNIISSEFQVNGKNINSLLNNGSSGNNNSDYINDKEHIAFKNKENDFSLPINTTQYNIKSNQVISDDNDNINIGNSQRKLNLQSSDGKLYLNGKEFKGGNGNDVKSGENEYDKITNQLSISEESLKQNLRLDKDFDFVKINSYLAKINLTKELQYMWWAYNGITEMNGNISIDKSKFEEIEGNNEKKLKDRFESYYNETDEMGGMYGSPNFHLILVDSRYINNFVDFFIPIKPRDNCSSRIYNKIHHIYIPRILKKYSIENISNLKNPYNFSFEYDVNFFMYYNNKKILDLKKLKNVTYWKDNFENKKDYSNINLYTDMFYFSENFNYKEKNISIFLQLNSYYSNEKKKRGYIKIRVSNFFNLEEINNLKNLTDTKILGFDVTFYLNTINIKRVISYLEDII